LLIGGLAQKILRGEKLIRGGELNGYVGEDNSEYERVHEVMDME